MTVIGGWFGVASGIALVVISWTHTISEVATWELFTTVGIVYGVWLVFGPIFARTLGVAFALAEPLVLVGAIVSAVTGQWIPAVALILTAFACDMGRRSAAASMDLRAERGLGDPAWPPRR